MKKIMRFKYFNELAPSPDHLTFNTIDKYNAGKQLHKCSYDIKFKILGQKSNHCVNQ